jgi:cytochrome oxidase Cu insertion factor (SCO1/SenC/PrrC family)
MRLGSVLVLLGVLRLNGASEVLAAGPAPDAPASVLSAVLPPESSVPKEVVGRVLAPDPAGVAFGIDLGGEHTQVEIDPPAAEIFLPGAIVRGFLRPPVEAGRLPRLENLWPAQPELFEALDRGVKALETALSDPETRLGTGSPFPFHALLDEHARIVKPDRFKGRDVLVNFLYGRCSDPTMCSGTAQRMASLHAALPERLRSRVEMVFVTLDPDFDTPARCLQYLRNIGIDRPGFCMLTGPAAATEGLYKLCGLRMERFGDTGIQHTQITFWIDGEGRMKGTFPGKNVSVESMVDALVAGSSDGR